jgi:hypothetical protein
VRLPATAPLPDMLVDADRGDGVQPGRVVDDRPAVVADLPYDRVPAHPERAGLGHRRAMPAHLLGRRRGGPGGEHRPGRNRLKPPDPAHGILDALNTAQVETVADTGYQGAGPTVRVC